MKRKVLISFLLVMLFFGCIVKYNAFAIDELMNSVLTQMDTSQVGITEENRVTKVVRTIYAIVNITVIGGCLIYLTAHSTKFFSGDPNERKKAKEALPYRVFAIMVILGIDGLISILVKYFTP